MVRWVGLVFVGLVICAAMLRGASFSAFFDASALIFVLGIVIGGVWWSFGPKTAFRVLWPTVPAEARTNISAARQFVLARRRARSLAFGAGILGLLIGFIAMLASLSDPSQMGPSLALALLSPFYASILAWLFFSGRPRGMAA